MIEFIFMLTHNDRTVDDAPEVLESLRDSGLRYVGFKDVGATPERQRELTEAAHRLGMEVMLEVVSTSREDELNSLRAAREAGVDWVLGGTNADAGLEVLAGSGVRYCPFPGVVSGHPSALSGEISEIADHAKKLTALDGVHGVDLLTYRHAGADPEELTRAVAEAADGPVIAAGSVVTQEQIRLLAHAGAWGFTIGGAIFERKLPGGDTVAGQVKAVLAMAADA
ncbi:hypothetical protein ACF1A5_06375 [Streptomyces sp. NPDC014864]|uniref:hypothetical protein n=1 Tax=Streptomyces sp. NPDC014864 TaxID=3364924 RepID=UPI0036F7ADBE